MRKMIGGVAALLSMSLAAPAFAHDKPITEQAGDSISHVGHKLKHKGRSYKYRAKEQKDRAKAKAEDEKSKD